MKKSMIVGVFGILTVVSASAFAEVPCSQQIKAQAEAKAEQDGYGRCVAGEPTLANAVELRLEYGTIGLICSRNISPMSVVREPVSYLFSRPATASCSDVKVYDVAAE